MRQPGDGHSDRPVEKGSLVIARAGVEPGDAGDAGVAAESGSLSGSQWSPPLIGGNTGYPATHHEGGTMPQWSPPLIGRNSRIVWVGHRVPVTAAMEPAVDRREQGSGFRGL